MEPLSGMCPLCGSELSKTKFVEIQTKIREQEKQNLVERKKRIAEATATARHEIEQEFKEQLEKERAAAAKDARQDLEQQLKTVARERDEAEKKAKDSQLREASIRKQAEQEKEEAANKIRQAAEQQLRKISAELGEANKKTKEAEAREIALRRNAEQDKRAAAKQARQEAETEIKKISAERDEAEQKLKAAEAKQAQIRKEAEATAEAKHAKELADQRAVFERDKTTSLLKQAAESNRKLEAVQKKLKQVEQQLQKKTSNELGDGGEIDVFDALRETFPHDHISRIKKGQPGADVLIEVLHKGRSCGRIVVDSKNRQAWQNGYVTKIREDQLESSAEHAILASTVFPAGKKEMCIESDVIVVSPARVVHIVQILRQAMMMMHIRGLSMQQRAGKMDALYKLITSETYANKFSEVGKLTREILDIDVDEKRAHDQVWKKRGTAAMKINRVLREIETEVASVIEGDEERDASLGYGVRNENRDAIAAGAQRK